MVHINLLPWKAKDSSWERRIQLASKRGRFLRRDIKDAESFSHCSVGESFPLPFPLLPVESRHSTRTLLTPAGAAELGFAFYDYVDSHQIAKARFVHHVVQRLAGIR
jgi:hypothetical protein